MHFYDHLLSGNSDYNLGNGKGNGKNETVIIFTTFQVGRIFELSTNQPPENIAYHVFTTFRVERIFELSIEQPPKKNIAYHVFTTFQIGTFEDYLRREKTVAAEDAPATNIVTDSRARADSTAVVTNGTKKNMLNNSFQTHFTDSTNLFHFNFPVNSAPLVLKVSNFFIGRFVYLHSEL